MDFSTKTFYSRLQIVKRAVESQRLASLIVESTRQVAVDMDIHGSDRVLRAQTGDGFSPKAAPMKVKFGTVHCESFAGTLLE